MRKLTKIILHCSATPAERDVDAAEIRRWHRDRGWSDIGYHFVVRLDGTVEIGRSIEKIGAHCKGHNADSIGICYVGGLNYKGKRSADTRTPEQKLALIKLVRQLRQEHGPLELHGHNEFSDKDCPCFDVQAEKHLYDAPQEQPHSAGRQGVLYF